MVKLIEYFRLSPSEYKRICREKILKDGYGKFDYVEEVLGAEHVLNDKPRNLIARLCEELGVEKESFKYQSFVSWHGRYKKVAQKKVTAKSAGITE